MIRHRLLVSMPISGEDLCRHALAAFYRASRDSTAPIDYPQPEVWSSPETLLDTFLDLFQLRVRAQMHQAGVLGYEADFQRLTRWLDSKPECDRHVSEVDPGLWQEMQAMGQGGPAPACGGTAAATSVSCGDAVPSPTAGPAHPADRFGTHHETAAPRAGGAP